MQASWNDAVIASSDDIVKVEGNAYFPPESLVMEHLQPSDHRTTCGWKGGSALLQRCGQRPGEQQRCLVLPRAQICCQ